MKEMIKHSHRFGLVLALCVMVFSGCSCSAPKPTPDPLAGWQRAYGEEPNQTIVKDYKDYIQQLPAEERGYVGPLFYFKDGTGQHAVNVEIFEGNKNASWKYVLIYDKDDKRIKAVRFDHITYQS